MKFKILALVMFGFPFLGVLLGSGCSKPITPVVPTVPIATNTPTITATMTFTAMPSPGYIPTPPIGIVWDFAEIQGSPSGVFAQIGLNVNQVAESTAGVTLTTPSGPMPLSYTGTGGTIWANYQSSSGWSYQAGFNYSLTTVTSIGTASATLTAPGGNVTLSPDGMTASWQTEGNADWLNIHGPLPGFNYYYSSTYTSDIDSPYSIPASVYSGPGTYVGTIDPQSRTFNITGAASGSEFYIEYMQPVTVVK